MNVRGFGWIGLVIILRIISTQPGSLKVDESLLISHRFYVKVSSVTLRFEQTYMFR